MSDADTSHHAVPTEEFESQLREAHGARDAARAYTLLRSHASEIAASHSMTTLVHRLVSTMDASDVDGLTPIRARLLRNSTLEPFVPYLHLALAAERFVPEIGLGDYDTFEPHASDDAEWDLHVIHFDPDRLIGDALFSADRDVYEAVSARVEHLVDVLCARGDVILSTLPAARIDPSHAYSAHTPGSWDRTRRALNDDFRRWADTRPGLTIFDLERVVGHFGTWAASDVRGFFAYQLPFSSQFMPAAAMRLARTISAARGRVAKCIVLDCDNTLWGGVLGEDGPAGVRLGQEFPGNLYRTFQLFVRSLTQRGLLLALNSKNNERDVLEFIETSPDMVLALEDLTTHRINWQDKAGNLREIAEELNIGLDSLVFVDDSAVECERIRSAFPETRVLRFPTDPLEIPRFIDEFPAVDVRRVTDDDLLRSESLKANAARASLRRSTPDLRSFIGSLDIQLKLRRNPLDRIERVAQLTQRTNQFNLTTIRYSVAEIEELAHSGTIYTLDMADRFSDYGTVGTCIVRSVGGESVLDSLILSCRAFGRHAEDTFLQHVLSDLRAGGAGVVRASYRPTRKNPMVREFYDRHGFTLVDETKEGIRTYVLEFTTGVDEPPAHPHAVTEEWK